MIGVDLAFQQADRRLGIAEYTVKARTNREFEATTSNHRNRCRSRMSVYIDDMYRYAIGQFKGMRMSHMIADSADELHLLAGKIGMLREWYQADHYDVPLPRRYEAIAEGAIPVTYRQCGMMRRRKAVEGVCGEPDDAARWYKAWLKTRATPV